ncbi:MAG: hypothetical protein Q7J38_15520 [Gallionella sp.]|nr:hypothetical protein [Gallionella sp.]
MMNLMWKNKKLSWTNELSVGNAVIDAEHKNLINMVNDIVDAIRARDHDDLEQAFEMLDDWISVHFLMKKKSRRRSSLIFQNINWHSNIAWMNFGF